VLVGSYACANGGSLCGAETAQKKNQGSKKGPEVPVDKDNRLRHRLVKLEPIIQIRRNYFQAGSSFWLASQKKGPCFTNLIEFLSNYFSLRPLHGSRIHTTQYGETYQHHSPQHSIGLGGVGGGGVGLADQSEIQNRASDILILEY
jgi:hypothetical protein